MNVAQRGGGPVAEARGAIDGEIGALVKLAEKARQEALTRMLTEAGNTRAHGVSAMRYDMTNIGSGVMEVLCYGTAVTVEALC